MTDPGPANSRGALDTSGQVRVLGANACERILRVSVVLERTGLSRSTLYRKVREGSFPKPLLLGARCSGWHESAVDAWIRNPMIYRVDKSSRG